MLPKGLELIVGVQVDPRLGPMVLLGMGGILVEIFRDTVLYPAPVSIQEAHWMIRSLKSYPLLKGYRGGERLDIEALAETIASISAFAAENRNRIAEVEINPLFVYEKGEGVAAADGLVILQD